MPLVPRSFRKVCSPKMTMYTILNGFCRVLQGSCTRTGEYSFAVIILLQIKTNTLTLLLSMEQLPLDLLAKVLCCLPLSHHKLGLQVVCKKWRDALCRLRVALYS